MKFLNKVVLALKLAGLENEQNYSIDIDTNIEVFEVLFQFYESTIGFQMSSSHHFNENTHIQDLVLVIEITALFNLDQVVEDLISNSLEPNINEKN